MYTWKVSWVEYNKFIKMDVTKSFKTTDDAVKKHVSLLENNTAVKSWKVEPIA